jgi:hypothetical protein
MKRFILLLAMAVFTIMAISSCTGDTFVQSAAFARDDKAPQYKKVFIHTKGQDASRKKPDVYRRCEELKYGGNEQIEWIIVPNNVKFTIRFNKNDSPFESDVFDNEHNISGPPVVDPGENDDFYAYSLEVIGHQPVDPGVIIWR